MIIQTDPKASYLAYRDAIDEAMQRVLVGGRYILGVETQSFETEFARYIGVAHAVGVASGTDAIELALRACGIGAGDQVITVSHTAVATVAAIELCGATPILIDIDRNTCTMDPRYLESTLAGASAGRIRAVVAVHLYGRPADLSHIREICDRYGVLMVEDCAQSHGAAIGAKRTGAWGHVAAFSFYPTKNLGALGDGGAVTTNDANVAERTRSLREYGWRDRYVSDIPGKNSRLDELQAAVLRVKLAGLDADNARRREIARAYDDGLRGGLFEIPDGHEGHVYHQYVIRVRRRSELIAHLKRREIGTLIHYPVPIHLQPAYRERILIGAGGLSVSEDAAAEVLSLPMFPQLTSAQVEEVVTALRQWSAPAA